MLIAYPTLFGTIAAPRTWIQFARHVGYLWLVVGVSGPLFRTVQLCFIRSVLTGVAWMTKILTDPVNDAKLYWRAPMQLARGGLIAGTLATEREYETVDLLQ